jgi:predicted dehydrogenase
MNQIRVGIIGFGVGKLHATALRSVGLYYRGFPPIDFVAVATATPESGQRAVEDFGFEWSTTDYHRLLEDKEINTLVIATPTDWHLPMLKDALHSGKAIYMDKPLAVNLDQAEQLWDTAQQTGNNAQMAFEFRFCPALQTAHDIIQDGHLGELYAFRLSYFRSSYVDPNKPLRWKGKAQSDGGVLNDYASHLIDLLLWLTQSPQSIAAQKRTFITERPIHKGAQDKTPVETDDHTTLLCSMPEGGTGTIEVGRLITGAVNAMVVELYGSKASLKWNLMNPNYLLLAQGAHPSGESGWVHIPTAQRYPDAMLPGGDVPVGMMRFHVASVADFLRRTLAGEPYDPDIAQGLRVQAVIEAANRSVQLETWAQVPLQD